MQGKSPVAHRRVAFLSLLALGSCGTGQALAEPTSASPANVAAQEVQRGVSLVLTVDDADLAVGDELHFKLAFRNASGDAAVVVPPLDGSWDGMRQPAYELVFADAKGQPLPHALGFTPNARCGLTTPIEPKDRRVLGARSKLEIEDAHAWAPSFRVLDHARPGVVSLRVRYRADGLSGATPLALVSNPVELTIRGGNEALWACRNAQAERARQHVYAENTPSRLVAREDGYVLVYRRTETHVRPGETSSIGAVFAQQLGPRGEPVGAPVEIARSDKDWLGLVETLDVPGGLLVAFTTARGEEDRDVRLVYVDTSQGAPRPGSIKTISKEPGRPFFLALARAGARAGIVWQGRVGGDEVLRFRPLGLNGEPTGSAVSIASSAGLAGGNLLFEPVGGDYLLAWHQGGPELRLQRLAADGASLGSAGTVKLADTGTLVALGTRGDRVGIVYADSSLNHAIARDTMGLHAVELSAADFRLLSDTPASPWDQQTARFGAAAWSDSRLTRVWSEDRRLLFASEPGAQAPQVLLSQAAGGTHGLWATADKSRILATWTDSRDDDQRQCAPSANCVSEVYVAVLDPTGKVLVPPARATRTAVSRPVALHQANWAEFCAKK
ncbi:hypothetical protein [Polyangium sp. y55x31]|uniref:hypothetical protein n=1 Tax=Polyangium sp. y55x31 TaxID=3042688 RepID=UPI002482B17B|nr:hypothetical protein [Polyangium sp. y55x31]MDI1475423.1 hypothetical protein [Polyangium sp. y55x31]